VLVKMPPAVFTFLSPHMVGFLKFIDVGVH
jgi:hypothetical protein